MPYFRRIRRAAQAGLTVALLALTAAAVSPALAAELVMFEAEDCVWCKAWHREIGESYALTTEGRAAPLRRVDLDRARPRDLRHIRKIIYTPTFVLLDEGREVGRITGYPGEDFFWPILDELLERMERARLSACRVVGKEKANCPAARAHS